jgi:uncharacterized protein YggE
MLPDLQALSSLLDILAKAGVTKFKSADLELALQPASAVAASQQAPAMPGTPAPVAEATPDELLFWSAT